MKIYKHLPEYIIRLQISKIPLKREWVFLYETTLEEVKEMVEKVILKQNLSPFEKGKMTSVNIRESKDGKNGKALTVSFKGLDPIKVKELIINHLNNDNEN